MKFNPKDYVVPSSLDEAISLLNQYGESATIIAGGVTFYEIAKRGLLSDTKIIVDLSKLNLDHVRQDNDGMILGSMVTFAQLIRYMKQDPKSRTLNAIYDVLSKFVPYQVRTLATIGGSVCSSVPFLDMPTALTALGATLRTATKDEKREIKIDQFYVGFFQNILKKSEIVTEIFVPWNLKRTGSAFQNLKRTALDIPILNAACKVTLDERRERFENVAAALGGIQEKIIRLPNIEESLIDRSATAESISKACEFVEELEPIGSAHAGPDYKREMAKLLLNETINKATIRARERSS